MAARSDDPDVSPESAAAVAAGGEIWGTLEELLLACAVSRHGTASWDSVAMEVQSRSPSAAARLTPASCRLRFRLLHRRFAAGADEDGDGEEPDAPADADSWVEELRKLRVAELRREVERYDLSIGSLQSKVKRLKEERERSLSGEGTPAVKKEQDAGEGSPEEADGEDRVSGGEESGRSCKESNSSDLKRPVHDDAGAADDDHGDAAVKEEPVAPCELTVKGEASGESVAGSKEADAGKESSDVQSSASPSRRRRRRLRKVAGDEAVSTSTSAPVPLPAAESEPLLAFLESVRTSKFGSVFERRLESQVGGRYRGTIRRHVDLEMIRSKLESGAATTTGQQGTASCRYASASEFYRDLLLLCANALVYFPRGSPEHAAAARTRAVVSKHISSSLRKDGLGNTGKAAAVVGGSSAEGTKKPKADAEIAGSLLEKATPIIVCRKRSSIAKAAAAAAKEEKVEKAEAAEEEEDNEDKKKGGTKDNARGLRTNKSRGPLRNAAPNQKTGKASDSGAAAADATKKSDKKGGGGSGSGGGKGAAGGVIKKRNAVDFLNRMKQNSVPSTERVSLLETLKLSAATEQKKSGKGGDNRKDTRGSGSKKAVATDTPSGGRRSVGRPPKRAAAPPKPPPSKRAKDDRQTTRKRGKK